MDARHTHGDGRKARLAAGAAERVALVIGNGAYEKVPYLANPGNDAADVGDAFERLGYSVTRLENAGREALFQGLQDFKRAAGASEVAVVFYAGHGIEVDKRNYLVPVDAQLARDDDVEYETVSLELVMRSVERARGLQLVILDACRDNPFAARMQSAGASRSIGRGLARVAPSGGTMVAYAAEEGKTAADGDGRNSPYTGALLRYLEEPGLDVGRLFRKVRDEVLRETGGSQKPFEYGALPVEDVYLASGAPPPKDAATAAAGGTPQPPPSGDAARAYEAAERVGTVAAYRAFIRRFPGSFEAELAQAQIDKLGETPLVVAGGDPDDAVSPTAPSPPSPDEAPPGTRFRDCAECPELVVVPSGTYMMGSPSGESGRSDTEGPVHRVRIGRAFAVGVYEVTFAEWDACVSGGGCYGYRPDDEGWGRGRRPVINVSWEDAQGYVRWLSRKTGQEYRLLSESEWEYVARGGTTGPFHTGSTISTEQANYNGDYTYGSGRKGRHIGKTVKVGSYPSNGFGLHDVHGNVWEWVEDCWNGSYAGAPTDGSAWESGNCAARVLRGGSWNDSPRDLRSANRFRFATGIRGIVNGFRVARTLTP